LSSRRSMPSNPASGSDEPGSATRWTARQTRCSARRPRPRRLRSESDTPGETPRGRTERPDSS